GHSGIDAFDQPLRRRQRLAEGEPAGALVEDRHIGEGAADVGGETKRGAVGAQVSRRSHAGGSRSASAISGEGGTKLTNQAKARAAAPAPSSACARPPRMAA